jgi:hypothetical protein
MKNKIYAIWLFLRIALRYDQSGNRMSISTAREVAKIVHCNKFKTMGE